MEQEYLNLPSFVEFCERFEDKFDMDIENVLFAAIDTVYDNILLVEHEFEFDFKTKISGVDLAAFSSTVFNHELSSLLWLHNANPVISIDTFTKWYQFILGLKNGVYVFGTIYVNEFDEEEQLG
jgi:hypothetical protein